MNKECVARFGVSLKKDLLAILDKMVKERGYTNRSLAIADMVRDQYVQYSQQQPDLDAAGSVTLVYDHHTRNVQETLTSLQHDHSETIVSTLHVHLDHRNCLEVLVVRGKISVIKTLADRLIGAKGVKHGKLCITTTGKDLPS
jgi:CopG family transcriptional regulator, nickel-responsive regulator